MKRFLCVCLTVAMLLTVGVVGASAADANDYSENLIVYWDFEPTGGGKLADKATAGSYENNLTEMGDGIIFENGKVTIPKDKNVCLYEASTSDKDEMRNITSAMTVGLKLNIDELTARGSIFVGQKNHFGFNVSGYTAATETAKATYQLSYRHELANTGTKNVFKTKTAGETYTAFEFECGKDYYIFVTVVQKTSTTAILTGYWSEDGETFTTGNSEEITLATTNTTGNIVKGDKQPIYVGKVASNIGDNKTDYTCVVSFDDIWIFNAAVDATSLPVIVKNRFNYADNGEEVENAPAFRGLQTSPIDENGQYKIRFVGTVDSLDYATVGFEIRITDYNNKTDYPSKQYFTNTVYDEILGTENGNQISYTATDLGGTFIFALTLDGFPADGSDITMEIKPCYKTLSDDTVAHGKAYSVTVNNGRVTTINTK